MPFWARHSSGRAPRLPNSSSEKSRRSCLPGFSMPGRAWGSAFGLPCAARSGGRPSGPGSRRATTSGSPVPSFRGGVIGPALLMFALAASSASSVSLLLNLESVFTALLAWFVFRENFDRRLMLGMSLIVCGGVILGWRPGDVATSWPALAVAGACLCWALDNNLTRKISAGDSVKIAAIKGLAAGTVNLCVAAVFGAALPAPEVATAAALIGVLGYGVSLALFVVALRQLGTARTAAYFSTAPFIGAA